MRGVGRLSASQIGRCLASPPSRNHRRLTPSSTRRLFSNLAVAKFEGDTFSHKGRRCPEGADEGRWKDDTLEDVGVKPDGHQWWP